MPSRKTSTSSVSAASSKALSAPARATVRIVPSFGCMTALYAVSTARCAASQRMSTLSSCSVLTTLVKPRKSWERITPELPRAPRRLPDEIALQRLRISISSMAFTSFAADRIVIVILVPVSPSGTGKTFSSLMCFLFASRFFAPARNIFESCAASIVFICFIRPPVASPVPNRSHGCHRHGCGYP